MSTTDLSEETKVSHREVDDKYVDNFDSVLKKYSCPSIDTHVGEGEGKGWGAKIPFSRRQWTYLAVFGVANIFRAVSILISGPFYPPEAKNRGLSDSEIGFVFGSYDFSTFLVSLIFGKIIIPKLGPRLVFILSALNLGICTVLFGCLVLTENKTVFITFSFIIRIIAGAGDAGFYPSIFTIFAQEFPGNVSTAIGLIELLFGVGAVLGPIAFGAVIDSIGFLIVYAIVGCLILLSALMTLIFAPNVGKGVSSSTEVLEMNSMDHELEGSRKWFHILTIPALIPVVLNLFTTAASIGFITATLESHLSMFGLSTFETSAVFIISNLIYTGLTPVWGKISDKFSDSKNALIISTASLIGVGFSFFGPLPFISPNLVLWSTILGLSLHGIGIGGAVMSAFPHAVQTVVADGFPDTEATYSLISSIYILIFTFGNAVGPSVSGVLVDTIGFQWATLFIVGLAILVVLSAAIVSVIKRLKS